MPASRANGGHRMAGVQGFVLRHQVLGDHASVALHFREVQEPVVNDGKVRRSNHRDHAGQGLGFAGVDTADARVGMRAAQHPGV